MSFPGVPPPTYSSDAHTPSASAENNADAAQVSSDAQLLICPSANFLGFQNGYLGAADERAAVEGELQIKGIPISTWKSLTVSFSSTESIGDRVIELYSTSVQLFSRSQASESSSNSHTVASSVPFSIPLMDDTPQCLHVGNSSLSHVLTAVLDTDDPTISVLTKCVPVHTRRFTSHLFTSPIQPYSNSLSVPTPVQVQLPRTSFAANELIPVYVTIPPPDRSVILDQGFTLRSVRAELIRRVRLQAPRDGTSTCADTNVGELDDDLTLPAVSDSAFSDCVPPNAESSRCLPASQNDRSSFDMPLSISRSTALSEAIMARSGSSCRFHMSRDVKLRLVLHTGFSSNSPHLQNIDRCDDDGTRCASISQMTLLHNVDFRIQVRVTFLHMSSRSEQTFPIIIPVTILPPPAPLPEVDSSLDHAYMKKHDFPPLRTNRRDDADVYHDVQDPIHAGPSAQPPPFDDAPPPFHSVSETATSSRLPTFLESEAEMIIPPEDHPAVTGPLAELSASVNIEGEGTLFGFRTSECYDGHSSDFENLVTPPPPLEMSEEDTDVTVLADMVDQPDQAMSAALNRVLDHQHDSRSIGSDVSVNSAVADGMDELLPPPPPPVDDPSDPPPSIDTDFRSRELNLDLDPPPSILSTNFRTIPVAGSTNGGNVSLASLPHHSSLMMRSRPSHTSPRASSRAMDEGVSNLDLSALSSTGPREEENGGISPSRAAPPPYLNPGALGDTEHAHGPPPYVDVMPNTHGSVM